MQTEIIEEIPGEVESCGVTKEESSTEPTTESTTEQTTESTQESVFSLSGNELYDNDDSKDLKGLLEEFVNVYGLPKEQVDKFTEVLKGYGERAAGLMDSNKQQALSDYLASQEKEEQRKYEDWVADNVSSPEELDALLSYGKKKFSDTSVLKDPRFLSYLKKDLGSYSEVGVGYGVRFSARRDAEKLREEADKILAHL